MLNTWSMILNNWSYCFSCFKIKYWREKYILCFDQKHPAPFILINFWPFLDMTIVLFQTFCTVSIRFQKSFIQRFSASSSLFIFPPWNCVSFFLELHKCHHSQLAPSSPTCVWSNELRERERKRKGICSIFFSWISSQRKLIRLIDSPAHNIPLFLQRPLFYPTYGH